LNDRAPNENNNNNTNNNSGCVFISPLAVDLLSLRAGWSTSWPQSIWQVGICYSRGMGCVGDADMGLEYKKKALAMGYIEWDEKKKPGH
jgi:hypothetical protein